MERVVVLYDDGCGFCRWAASRVARWDQRQHLTLAPIRGPEGDARLGQLDSARRDGSFHVITRDGHIASAGAAVPFLLRELPGGTPLAGIADAFPRTTDRVYRAVARRRGPLGRLMHVDECRVPSER
jgi:predicted DCC family thiol-disulfide oxidoreductase YuxK